jgi:hypothetical protein
MIPVLYVLDETMRETIKRRFFGVKVNVFAKDESESVHP